MRSTPLTSDEVEVLQDVRKIGSLVLQPEARSFAHAKSLTDRGLLRCVTLRGVSTSTFLLSGEGIAFARCGSGDTKG
jgi:hypothetical protein